VNGPPQGGWQERARRFGWTVLFVAFAISLAVDILRVIAPVLAVGAIVAGVIYLVVAIVRYRRSRW
jgi:hypothetical protein